jgi:hypothetical protein
LAHREQPTRNFAQAIAISYITLGIVCLINPLCHFCRGDYSFGVVQMATGFGDPIDTSATVLSAVAAAPLCSQNCLYGSCAREAFGSAGSLCLRFANLRTAVTLRLATKRDSSFMTQGIDMNRYISLTSNADDQPLYVDTTAPLHVLLDAAGYRIRAVTQFLENIAMRDERPVDPSTLQDLAQLCCITLRDGCDVMDVIARRLDAAPAGFAL